MESPNRMKIDDKTMESLYDDSKVIAITVLSAFEKDNNDRWNIPSSPARQTLIRSVEKMGDCMAYARWSVTDEETTEFLYEAHRHAIETMYWFEVLAFRGFFNKKSLASLSSAIPAFINRLRKIARQTKGLE